MKCPNPACNSENFNVRVEWKRRAKVNLPIMPVILNCVKCGHQIKAWVINDNLKDIQSQLKLLFEGQKQLFDQIEELKESKDKRGFLDSIKKRLK